MCNCTSHTQTQSGRLLCNLCNVTVANAMFHVADDDVHFQTPP